MIRYIFYILEKGAEMPLKLYTKCLQVAEGFGKRSVSRPESAEGALPTRGKLCVSRFTDGTHQFILLFQQVEILIST
mgnify:CR=1 FL=1